MATSLDCLELCRLCLAKEQVEVPIFKDGTDMQQIFYKIQLCLPVKVERQDKLPKKICNECVCKLETCYDFWNTTANSEKQLLQWLENNVEDKQTFVEVLNTNVMKQEQSSDNRLEGNFIQVGGQNSIDMTMIDNMSIITMPAGSEQQFTTVPMDTNGTVQTVQVVSGPSTQTSYDQNQIVEELEESEDDDMDDGNDNEGLPVKEETEEDQSEQQTTYINVPVSCDEAGPSGLQQQNISELTEMTLHQAVEEAGDPKSGEIIILTSTQLDELSEQALIIQAEHSLDNAKSSDEDNSKSIIISLPSSLINKSTIKRVPKRSPQKAHATRQDKGQSSQQGTMTTYQTDHSYLVEVFTCDHCDLKFEKRKDLRLHLETNHKNTKYFCLECNTEFKCRQSEREHWVRKHTVGYRFACEACGKKFKMKNDLYMHVQSIHDVGGREVVCELCGRAYRNSFALKKHLAHAHNQRQFSCSICKRKLATQETLEQHMLMHSKKERAVCQICGKTFSGNDSLKKHMRIHTGARPFPCKICGRAFRRQNTHKQHLLTHTGKRPYVCDICGKSFTQKPGLITHRKKHPGPLPPLPAISIDYVIEGLFEKGPRSARTDENGEIIDS